ncbi:dicarboxylate--CoA ligase PimA [Microvirga terrestris]|uniref:Long-chain-fatty-acid--CoA ligase n=1 Tax=Microvirga terrestris TaxID=2791024 RepID=A0ABS0HS69_9HYPH|nr:dicarboxylate--CoA ligase PimA [Microvirga terrestris]MBF9196334.1 dicarboxylate--CoA ligase PimA [Microvirga terrestris]
MNRTAFPWERSYPPGVRWDAPIVPSTLPRLLDEAVAAYGDRPAIEYRDRPISYTEIGGQADAFAAALLRSSINPEGAVALYLPNTPYHPFAFFGAAKAGIRLAHLSPLDAERELAHKLHDSGARILVTTNLTSMLSMGLKLLDAGHVDRLIVGEDAVWGPCPAPVMPIPERSDVTTFEAFTRDAAPPAQWPAIMPDDIALLQYTGGTTGTPKGAILTHGNLTAAVAMYEAWFGPQLNTRPGEQKVICALPLFHIFALTTILLRQIKNGNEILLRLRFDPETTLRDVEVKRATAFPGVPTMWIALANHPGIEKRDFSSVIHLSSGGAPLPVEVGERFHRLTGQRLLGGWGMTETSPAGTNLPLKGPPKPGSIGIPMPGVELDIVSLDEPRSVLGVSETGELRVRGLNVSRGYWNKPKETAEAFTLDGFLTGDIGYMDEDGYFFIVDRRKDMIISGGFNVYPQMIEQAVYEHPQVEEALVIGIPDPYRGEAAKVFVKLKNDAPGFTLEELQAFLADKIGKHEMPAALEIREALPRTSVGKLSKIELRDAERRKAESATS